MKFKTIPMFVLCILLISSIVPNAASAATLNMNMLQLLNSGDRAKLGPVDPDKMIVADMEEDHNYYYYLLEDEATGKGFAVLYVNKTDFTIAKVMSVYDTASLKGYEIKSIKHGNNGVLWMDLSGKDLNRAVKIGSNEISTEDYPPRSEAKYGADSILWLEDEDGIIKRWDGEQTEQYKIKKQNVIDFAEHERQVYYLDKGGNVGLVTQNNEEIIANLLTLLHIQEDELDTGYIVSAGGKLWAAAGVLYHFNTPLINLSDNRTISGTKVGRIRKVKENADGTLNFLVQQFLPIFPNQPPGGDELQQITLSKGSVLQSQTVKGNWGSIEQSYKDQLGNNWTFNRHGTNKGLLMKARDETSIQYYFSKANKKADIKIKYNGNYIEFDAPPYIENGRTMVSLRGIAFLFGATSSWDERAKRATIQKDGVVISGTVGEKKATVNGKPITIETPVKIVNGRVVVPLRIIAENLLIKTDWDSSSKTITLKGK